ncbi:MAG: NUDIX hydrolase [Planctomycetota bacterium]|nr:NUDIX hydrolase [Planctomycetota bacterium]
MERSGTRMPASMTEVSRETILAGAKFSFEQVTVRTHAGQTLRRQIVRHPGSVVILPILHEAGKPTQIVLIRNYRIAPGRVLLELPAGTMEPPESAAVCAARELEEETGYAAAHVEELASFYTTPGMTDEYMHAFVATGLRLVGQHTEADESITVEALGVREAVSRMDSGEICDAKTLLVLQWALRRRVIAAD